MTGFLSDVLLVPRIQLFWESLFQMIWNVGIYLWKNIEKRTYSYLRSNRHRPSRWWRSFFRTGKFKIFILLFLKIFPFRILPVTQVNSTTSWMGSLRLTISKSYEFPPLAKLKDPQLACTLLLSSMKTKCGIELKSSRLVLQYRLQLYTVLLGIESIL